MLCFPSCVKNCCFSPFTLLFNLRLQIFTRCGHTLPHSFNNQINLAEIQCCLWIYRNSSKTILLVVFSFLENNTSVSESNYYIRGVSVSGGVGEGRGTPSAALPGKLVVPFRDDKYVFWCHMGCSASTLQNCSFLDTFTWDLSSLLVHPIWVDFKMNVFY